MLLILLKVVHTGAAIFFKTAGALVVLVLIVGCLRDFNGKPICPYCQEDCNGECGTPDHEKYQIKK